MSFDNCARDMQPVSTDSLLVIIYIKTTKNTYKNTDELEGRSGETQLYKKSNAHDPFPQLFSLCLFIKLMSFDNCAREKQPVSTYSLLVIIYIKKNSNNNKTHTKTRKN